MKGTAWIHEIKFDSELFPISPLLKTRVDSSSSWHIHHSIHELKNYKTHPHFPYSQRTDAIGLI